MQLFLFYPGEYELHHVYIVCVLSGVYDYKCVSHGERVCSN